MTNGREACQQCLTPEKKRANGIHHSEMSCNLSKAQKCAKEEWLAKRNRIINIKCQMISIINILLPSSTIRIRIDLLFWDYNSAPSISQMESKIALCPLAAPELPFFHVKFSLRIYISTNFNMFTCKWNIYLYCTPEQKKMCHFIYAPIFLSFSSISFQMR